MPRAALSQDQVDDFRESLCDCATQLFAEHGYEGVTMRALAKELACSPMTPYRYFENKTEIFDTIRAAASKRFGDAIQGAIDAHTDHRERLRAMCLAYVGFAIDEPHAYRIMFELDLGERADKGHSESLRGWRVMNIEVEEAIRAGVLSGDPSVVAHLLWSGVHGIVALHLSGMLRFGFELPALVDAFIEREIGRGPARAVPSEATPTPSR